MLGVRTRHSYRVSGGELRVEILGLALVKALRDIAARGRICQHIHTGVRTPWIVNELGRGKECQQRQRVCARSSRTEGRQVCIRNGLISIERIGRLLEVLGAEPMLAAIVQALRITDRNRALQVSVLWKLR